MGLVNIGFFRPEDIALGVSLNVNEDKDLYLSLDVEGIAKHAPAGAPAAVPQEVIPRVLHNDGHVISETPVTVGKGRHTTKGIPMPKGANLVTLFWGEGEHPYPVGIYIG